MSDGSPKRATQCLNNALAHVWAVMSVTGMASGHLVHLSTMVNSDQVHVQAPEPVIRRLSFDNWGMNMS